MKFWRHFQLIFQVQYLPLPVITYLPLFTSFYEKWYGHIICIFNPLPLRNAFNTFANRANPDQAALVRAACSGSTLFAYRTMIRYDPTLHGPDK